MYVYFLDKDDFAFTWHSSPFKRGSILDSRDFSTIPLIKASKPALSDFPSRSEGIVECGNTGVISPR